LIGILVCLVIKIGQDSACNGAIINELSMIQSCFLVDIKHINELLAKKQGITDNEIYNRYVPSENDIKIFPTKK
jgi:hypothetical protein